MANNYHNQWKALIADRKGMELLLYLFEGVVEPVLKRNQYYFRCQDGSLKENRGICRIMQEFKSYLNTNTEPSEHRIRLFGEMAYTLWLLTTTEDGKYEASVQRRINEFFRGGDYYGPGEPGFRQFEYELQTLCRFVEEGISFTDSPGEGEPDLTIGSERYRVEIKLPISNAVGALDKALKQLAGKGGCIMISLDNILSEASEQSKDGLVKEIAGQIYAIIKHRTDVAVVIEFYRNDCSTTDVAWIGNKQLPAIALVMHAVTGEPYIVGSLPSPLFGH